MNRRIFKPNRTTEYLEYFVLMEEHSTLRWQKYIFGFLVYEKHYNLAPFRYLFPSEGNLKTFFKEETFREEKGIREVPEAVETAKAIWKAQFQTIRSDLEGCKEITNYALYHPVFGILEEFGGVYQTQMVVPFLNGILEVFVEDIEVEKAAKQYKRLRSKYLEFRIPILNQMKEHLNFYADGKALESEKSKPEESFSHRNFEEEMEDGIRPRSLSITPKGIEIRWDCDWDEEHGISIQITPDGEMNRS